MKNTCFTKYRNVCWNLIKNTNWSNSIGYIVNLLIGLLLFYAGLKIIKNPAIIYLGTDKTSAATLTGALFGAGAIFIGNFITQIASGNTEKNKQNNLRSLLIAEIVSIFIEHARKAKEYTTLEEVMGDGTSFRGEFDKGLSVATPTVFNSIITQLTCLTNAEIEALVNLYDNLAKTRTIVENNKKVPHMPLTVIGVMTLKNCFLNDCENAADAVDLIKPTRRVQLPNDNVVLLSALLRNPTRYL